MMRNFTRLSDKINKKGYNFDPKRRIFRPRGDNKNKTYYNCGEKGHISPNCPKPDKRKNESKSNHRHDSSDDEEEDKKIKHKNFGRKKNNDKKTKLFPNKKGNTKRSFLVEKQEWVTDVSSSKEEDIITIALTHEESPLPHPPICLMAKGNTKVCEEDNNSDDELDPNEFANLINEYTSLIKREKGKVKVLESTHAKLELAHSDMLVKYNDLLEKHNESLVLAKQVEESHKKLKQEHRKLAHKYQEFEFAYEAIDPSLENSIYENVVRSMLLPHVMTCSLMTMLLMSCPSLSPLGKRNEDDLPRLHLAPPWHPKWMKMKKKMIHHHKRVFQRQHRKYKIDMSQVFHYKCKSSMIHLNKHPRMYR